MAAHPWLRPRWRRLAVIAVCATWLALEAWLEPEGLWLYLALGCTGWAIWDFFLSGTYAEKSGG